VGAASPPEAPLRAGADAAAAPPITVLETRLTPLDAPPAPSPIGARRRRCVFNGKEPCPGCA
jgi:hypothetical protein